MFLKTQNGETLRRLAEGDQSITRVHFAAPYNFRIPYDVTEDLNQFLIFFSNPTNISSLKLADLRLNKDQIITLARGIKNSVTLQKLVLKKIMRAYGGFWYIADALRHSVSMTHIVFEDFKMRPRNFSMITAVILSNEKILMLTIKKCTVFMRCIDSFCAYLSNNSFLTSLRLSNVGIDDIILARLLEMINHRNRLARLEVDHNKIAFKDKDLISQMEFNTSITYLNLSSNSIPIEGIVALAGVLNKNKTLTHLNFSGITFRRVVALLIENLIVNTSLQRLSLAHQSFDEDELTALGDFFSRNHQYTRLSLRRSYIYQGRLSLLCNSLRANSRLTRVNLSGVCNDDIALDSLAAWLKTNTSLTHLTLRNNYITSSRISTLCNALAINNTLTFLDLGENYIGTLGAEKLARSLVVNHSLLQLKLAQNYIGDEGIRLFLIALRRNIKLKKLNIRDNAYCAEGINYAIQLLEERSGLILSMYDRHLQGSEGIHYLQKALINNPKINRINYKCKAGKRNKKTLLTFGLPATTALSEALFNNHSLTRLSIYAGNFGDAGTLQLVEALRSNETLEELIFIQCDIQLKGVEILCAWLKKNTRVRKLNLENSGYLSAAAKHFAELLTENCYLTELSIAKYNFDESALLLIFTALTYNTTLRKLDVNDYSSSGKEFYSFMSKALSINQTLTHLNICPSFSFFSDKSHDALELVLSNHFSIVYCKYSPYVGNQLGPIIRNRDNKNMSLWLLKEYAIIKLMLEDKKCNGKFHFIFSLQKDLFFLILSYVYPSLTPTLCKQRFLSYRLSYQGMQNPATFFNPNPASNNETDNNKRQKIDKFGVHP